MDDSIPPAPCRIEWIEIPAPDLDAAVRFYTEVFGWKTERYSDDFVVFTSGTLRGGFSRAASSWAAHTETGSPAGGPDSPAHRAVNRTGHGVKISITVADIEKTLRSIAARGGRVVRAKYEIGPGLGVSAMFRDPNGNVADLWSEA